MNKRLTYKELEGQITQIRGELASKDDEVNKIKSSFLSNFSHEIRTPMNVIVGFSNLLNDSTYNQEQIGFFIDEINKSSKELLILIDNVILTAKVENDNVAVDMKMNEINSLMNDLYSHFQQKLKNANKRIELKLISTENYSNNKIFTDPRIMKEILNNLFENAAKYAINGSLEFGYRILGEKTAEFFVRDSTQRINNSNNNRFYKKINGSDNNALNGGDQHGIGLTISDKLIRLLGGKLTVKSTFENGSSFNFTIPLLVEKPV
ncbi:MAG: hypothetical protein K8R86_05195, partial [Bacteroidales bacterium]|nr:hypothetical protein [Bacteroidales bacterium]